MRTTALLTLTGTGTVIREWFDQLAAGSVSSAQLMMLGAAILGLGLQTLLSHHKQQAEEPVTSGGDIRCSVPASIPIASPSV